MEMNEYDEIRATARLPNLDIEILHRRPWEGNEEQIVVMLRAVPSFEAVGRWLEASNPERNIGILCAALGASTRDTTFLFFALAQFPVYIGPQIIKALPQWLALPARHLIA